MEELIKNGIFQNCKVVVINSIIKKEWEVDFLLIDEVHSTVSDQMRRIFDCVTYNFILCLTGTLERLDGKEILLQQYAPVCDKITLKEAEENG